MPIPPEYTTAIKKTLQAVECRSMKPHTAQDFFTEMRSALMGDPDVPLSQKPELLASINEAIETINPSEKPVSELTYEELIKELREKRINPLKMSYGQTGDEGRRTELLVAFMNRADEYKEEPDGDERLRLHVLKVTYLLERMAGTLDRGTGAASVPRENLFKEEGGDFSSYMLSREDILILSYHPVWGRELRNILETCAFDAIGRGEPIPGTNSRLNYPTLVSERGQQLLEKYIDENPSFANFHDDAKSLAKLLFKVFDLPSIVLMENQKAANGTRGHNGGESIEPTIGNPFVLYPQNGLRYNDSDYWGAWEWALAASLGDGYGYTRTDSVNRGGRQIEVRTFDTEKLDQARKLVIAYFDCFFDVSLLSQFQIEPPGPLRSIFPTTLDLLYLGPNEVLDVLGTGLVKGDASNGSDSPNIMSWAQYDIAFKGYKKMLEIFQSDPGDKLSPREITASYEEGERGGLLSKILHAAGLVKIVHFPDRAMKDFFKGALFLYTARLIMHSNLRRSERIKLRDQVVRIILDTSGLSSFQSELEEVARALQSNSFLGRTNGWVSRRKKVKNYVKLYALFHGISKIHVWFNFLNKTKEQKILRQVLVGELAPPLPFSAEGTLLTRKE